MKSFITISILLAFYFIQVKSEIVDSTHLVTFKIAQNGKQLGDIQIAMFGKIAPKTVDNFVTFAGEGYQGLKYEGTKFHRVIKNFMVQGGDITSSDGSGVTSIYGGKYFDDEDFVLKHTKAGLLSMANAGKNTNGSQFFLTTVSTPWLDNHHIVFGKITSGMDVLKAIEATPTTDKDAPLSDVTIIKSTVVKYDVPKPVDV